jgi:hypothetical protein
MEISKDEKENIWICSDMVLYVLCHLVLWFKEFARGGRCPPQIWMNYARPSKEHVRIALLGCWRKHENWKCILLSKCRRHDNKCTELSVAAVNADEFGCVRKRNITALCGFTIGMLTCWSENYEKIRLLRSSDTGVERTRHFEQDLGWSWDLGHRVQPREVSSIGNIRISEVDTTRESPINVQNHTDLLSWYWLKSSFLICSSKTLNEASKHFEIFTAAR